jgi:hypothetical protein
MIPSKKSGEKHPQIDELSDKRKYHKKATIHRSSDAPVLNLSLDECIDNTHK